MFGISKGRKYQSLVFQKGISDDKVTCFKKDVSEKIWYFKKGVSEKVWYFKNC